MSQDQLSTGSESGLKSGSGEQDQKGGESGGPMIQVMGEQVAGGSAGGSVGGQGLRLADERRRDMRLAGVGGGHVEVVVMNRFSQPIEVLREPEVVNVSAGGLALATDNVAGVGYTLRVGVAGSQAVTVETMDCRPWLNGKYLVRCKVVSGKVPASLIYGW